MNNDGDRTKAPFGAFYYSTVTATVSVLPFVERIVNVELPAFNAVAIFPSTDNTSGSDEMTVKPLSGAVGGVNDTDTGLLAILCHRYRV